MSPDSYIRPRSSIHSHPRPSMVTPADTSSSSSSRRHGRGGPTCRASSDRAGPDPPRPAPTRPDLPPPSVYLARLGSCGTRRSKIC
ncbi:hypothetical protein E2C01_024268 [Portunus trituberculatus]|uniref:Uncharacterized protein n=1 Tax=Portunus trituberculatus TaxID=210409 RepID=A0A5B7ECC9_PORTR|nr:hypothetical protein [Portunus trituberculatus]